MERKAFDAGSFILNNRYRIVQLLYQRPRLNLYLARYTTGAPPAANKPEPLVAIRELVLDGLSLPLRTLVEAAAHQEALAPAAAHAPRPSTPWERFEGERHYFVMSLPTQRGEPLTLDELLLQQEWPRWLDRERALTWGKQLGRVLTHLHRQGVLLGDLSPTTILVDRDGSAPWSPLLLPCWPPAPHFWQLAAPQVDTYEQYDNTFPVNRPAPEYGFAAPELYSDQCDECSDLYALGALLYLLLTHYAPASAMNRLIALQQQEYIRLAPDDTSYILEPANGLELMLPRLLNPAISPFVEQVLLRALEIDFERRYASPAAFVEVLETIELLASPPSVLRRDERMRKLLRQICDLSTKVQ